MALMSGQVAKGKLKWALLVATLLSILLSWGKNFMGFTNFFLDYIPGYDKFRAVSMTLVIAEVTMPLLAFLGLAEIAKDPDSFKQNQKKFFIALGISPRPSRSSASTSRRASPSAPSSRASR